MSEKQLWLPDDRNTANFGASGEVTTTRDKRPIPNFRMSEIVPNPEAIHSPLSRLESQRYVAKMAAELPKHEKAEGREVAAERQALSRLSDMLAGGINSSFENPGDDTNYSIPERFTRMIQRTAPDFPVAKKIGPNGDNGNHAYQGSFAYQFGRAMDIYQQLNEQPEAVRLTLDEDPSAPSVDTKPRDMYIGFAPQGAAENALVIPLAQQEQRAA